MATVKPSKRGRARFGHYVSAAHAAAAERLQHGYPAAVAGA
ncbi:MAG: hypothetical protein ACREER_00690 [Alphaproteobacteria bacterium]